jgi:hypothetical protein
MHFSRAALVGLLSAATIYGEDLNVPTSADGALDSVYLQVNSDGLADALSTDRAKSAVSISPTPPAREGAVYPDAAKGRAVALLDARVGPNVRLGDDPDELPATQRAQVEPHIVRSAAQPLTLLATFQEGRFPDSGAISNGYAVSLDGGFTWRRGLTPQLTTPTGGRFNRATDPVAGAGPGGELYLQALASAQGVFQGAAVVVSRSFDQGVTWTPPSVVFESATTAVGPDKNWLAVNDYLGTPNAGRLVSTWTNFLRNANGATTGLPLIASISDDRGATWSAPIEITAAGTNHQGTQPVFLPDGSLLVVFVTFTDPTNTSRFAIQCKRSLDGGRTFPTALTTIVPAVVGWDDPQMRDGVFLPSAAVARESGDVFVSYTAVMNGIPRVMVIRSADRGATWSSPRQVSDHPEGISVMNATVAASPDGRRVAIVFTDKRHAPGGRDFVDHYVAFSVDGGTTWQPNIRLSDTSSEIRFGPLTSRGVMLGDYLGIAPPSSLDDAFVPVWCETRTGDADPFVARFVPAAQPDYAAWAQVHRAFAEPGHRGDLDGDGVPNYLEFLSGTDPRQPEFGSDLVLKNATATSVDVFWTERTGVQKSFTDGVASASYPLSEFAPFSASGTAGGLDEASVFPSVPPGEGRIWRGARLAATAPTARAFTRAYRFSAGLPVQASGEFTARDTDARLINVATRGRIGSGDTSMIVGFVIDGPKTMLVRAAGPALAALGVPGALANPRLTLSAAASDLERTNDDWQVNGSANAALFARVGAFPFAAGSLDSALALDVGPQAYTAVVGGQSNVAGVALVEAYDADTAPRTGRGRLVNLSTRGDAGAGDNALIAGFVLSGTQPRRVLIRAVGPGLAAVGIGAPLPDPVLTVFRGSTAIARNDDWESARSPAVIAAVAQQVGAFALARSSLDAALVLTLPPGAYTAVLGSATPATGPALVEIYDAD